MDTTKNPVSMTLTVATDAGDVTVRIEYVADAGADAHDVAITALDNARERLLWMLGGTRARIASPPARQSIIQTVSVTMLVIGLLYIFSVGAFAAGYLKL